MITFLAFLPLLIFFALILAFKRSVLLSVTVALFFLIAIGLGLWQIESLRLLSAGVKGLFITVEIILIIFGVLMILEILKRKGLVNSLKNIFESVSADKRVQVLLIGWGLVYFLEGIAGFGTPAIIAVPILIALGFAPVTAIVVSLIGDSIPVIFGAAGLPVTYGIMHPLSEILSTDFLFGNLSVWIAGFNILLGTLMPLVLLFVFTKMEKRPLSYFTQFIPFAATSGFLMSMIAFLTAYFLGPELPSIVGGAFGVAIIIFMAKNKILLPVSYENDFTINPQTMYSGVSNALRAIFPYAMVFFLLLLSRLPYLPVGDFLIDIYKIKIVEIFGFGINYQFSPLYSAGVIMIISAMLSSIFFRLSLVENVKILETAGKKIFRPFTILVLILVFVQIYIYSGENLTGLPSMLSILGDSAGFYFGSLWPLFAPFIGGLGAVTSGSATVSNLIFSGFQYQTAIITGYNPILILTLQGLGAAAGNMSALHNIVAATTVAGIVGMENHILRKTLPVLLGYLFIVGLLGLAITIIF